LQRRSILWCACSAALSAFESRACGASERAQVGTPRARSCPMRPFFIFLTVSALGCGFSQSKTNGDDDLATTHAVSSSGYLDKVIVGYQGWFAAPGDGSPIGDRKSTRLNSSHRTISYAVFCLKKKKKKKVSLPTE